MLLGVWRIILNAIAGSWEITLTWCEDASAADNGVQGFFSSKVKMHNPGDRISTFPAILNKNSFHGLCVSFTWLERIICTAVLSFQHLINYVFIWVSGCVNLKWFVLNFLLSKRCCGWRELLKIWEIHVWHVLLYVPHLATKVLAIHMYQRTNRLNIATSML